MTDHADQPDLSRIAEDLAKRLEGIDRRLAEIDREAAEETRGDRVTALAGEEEALRAIRGHLAVLQAETRRQAQERAAARERLLDDLEERAPALLAEIDALAREADKAAAALADALERRAEVVGGLAPLVAADTIKRHQARGVLGREVINPAMHRAGLGAFLPLGPAPHATPSLAETGARLADAVAQAREGRRREKAFRAQSRGRTA